MNNGISAKKKAEVAKKTNYHCAYCGEDLRFEKNKSNVTIDHVIPNKDNRIENLLLCCKKCNSSKKDRPLETFRYNCARNKAGCPTFTDKQIEYLESRGFYFNFPKFTFYYETIRTHHD